MHLRLGQSCPTKAGAPCLRFCAQTWGFDSSRSGFETFRTQRSYRLDPTFDRAGFGLGLDLGFDVRWPPRLSATAARMRSFKAASSTLSPSWMSMARLTLPSRLELKRPEGSFNAAPLANVILTTFLYVSPVQTMPP